MIFPRGSASWYSRASLRNLSSFLLVDIDIPTKTAGRQGLIVVRPWNPARRVCHDRTVVQTDATPVRTHPMKNAGEPSIVRSAKALFQISEKHTIEHDTGRFNQNRRRATSARPLNGCPNAPCINPNAIISFSYCLTKLCQQTLS